ncbi:MAG: FeoB-associated Cys-rich membrane protein [Treponema sp.]|nr:FeoB-associated Cys-rich membrane protein [Treponema sp.]
MWTLIVALIVLALVILAVAVMVRNSRKGKNSCGMNCSTCMSYCGNKTCSMKETKNDNKD